MELLSLLIAVQVFIPVKDTLDEKYSKAAEYIYSSNEFRRELNEAYVFNAASKLPPRISTQLIYQDYSLFCSFGTNKDTVCKLLKIDSVKNRDSYNAFNRNKLVRNTYLQQLNKTKTSDFVVFFSESGTNYLLATVLLLGETEKPDFDPQYQGIAMILLFVYDNSERISQVFKKILIVN